jgi:hypothetical protein
MKKSIALVIAASTLFLAGCCTTPHATKWEYKVVNAPHLTVGTDPQGPVAAWQSFLNDLGKDGWVLIERDGLVFYLKRPIK